MFIKKGESIQKEKVWSIRVAPIFDDANVDLIFSIIIFNNKICIDDINDDSVALQTCKNIF